MKKARPNIFHSAVVALSIAALAGCAPDSDIEEWEDVAEQEGALRVCADGSTVSGIDVSYFQGNIDWNKVASTSTEYAFIRVSYGSTFKDPKFDQNWAGARQAGVVRGVYQYFKPKHSVADQAQLLIDSLASDPLGPGDLPPVLDVETKDGVSNATLRARVQEWLNIVEGATGKRPIIYTAAFMQSYLGGQFGDYPLWVANYTTNCPLIPTGWQDWEFWQYTDKGTVSGISGAVDRNRFNGTLEDLFAFAGSGVAPSPDPDPEPDPGPDPEPDPVVGAPTGVVPAHGAAITSSAVAMACDTYSGATQYEFDIQRYVKSQGQWALYYTYTTTSPNKTFYPVTSSAYRLRVRARNGGQWSAYSNWNTFSFGGAAFP